MKTAPVAFAAAALVLGTLVITTHKANGQTTTSTPAPSPIGPTVDAAAFDFSTAKLYQSDSDVLEMQLPASWQSTAKIANNGSSSFVFTYGADPRTAPALLQFQLSSAAALYKNIDPTGKANSPDTALQTIIDTTKAGAASGSGTPVNFTPIADVKVGSLSGRGITAVIPTSAQAPETHFYLQVVPVAPDQALYVVARADVSVSDKALPLIDKMLASVVIKATNVPTPTVTPTLYPLLITATALQAQILALTPTATTAPTATPGVGPTPVSFPDGLQYTDTVIGTGATAQKGNTLSVKYTGKLTNGTVFDTTDNRGGTPYDFQLGAGQVIPGWDEGLVGMKVGGKRTLTIPPALGYGAQGQGAIPPNSTLIFDVELVATK